MTGVEPLPYGPGAGKAPTVEAWRRADAVCFDVDSTVITSEGIDELADFCGVGRQVQALTEKAMAGGWSFREALRERLEIVRPSQDVVKRFISERTMSLTPEIQDLVGILRDKDIPVYLISGGFREIIDPIAKILGIPPERVFANRLFFLLDGSYAMFDWNQPTSESGGKGVVIERLKSHFGYRTIVMIGDGAADLEACPPADAFIGFGGNVVRPRVRDAAAWFVTDFRDLIQALR